MIGRKEQREGLNARLGKNITSKKSRRDGKTFRRSLAGLTLVGTIGVLVVMLIIGR